MTEVPLFPLPTSHVLQVNKLMLKEVILRAKETQPVCGKQFSEHLLSTSCVPDDVQATEVTTVNKTTSLQRQ